MPSVENDPLGRVVLESAARWCRALFRLTHQTSNKFTHLGFHMDQVYEHLATPLRTKYITDEANRPVLNLSSWAKRDWQRKILIQLQQLQSGTELFYLFMSRILHQNGQKDNKVWKKEPIKARKQIRKNGNRDKKLNKNIWIEETENRKDKMWEIFLKLKLALLYTFFKVPQ